MTILQLFQDNAVIFYGVVGFIGLLVGSFLNVVIHRLPIMMQNSWDEYEAEMRAERAAEAIANSQPADATSNAALSSDASSIDAASETDIAASIEPSETTATFNLSTPRSRCPECGQLITWWQNIPVVSYLLLSGKCWNCSTPISASCNSLNNLCSA